MKTNKSILLIKSAVIAFVLTVIYSVIPFQAVCAEIPNDVFRFHILANSDSEEDQVLKLKVRDKVLEKTKILFDTANSKSDAEEFVKANLETIEKIAQNEVYKNGYNYPVKVEVVNMHFDTRYYEGYTLPAGMYDALRITIGNAKGHNWWCVMYPSICISTVDEGKSWAKNALSDDEYSVVTDDKVEYKFFIVELFQKIFVR
ncbi:stage II sporulation protein R [Ruminococcus bromii]|uniref:stage II sporulation protein R n=1 Tax=Ruminococcus bromii TaxID=40518 RepID=UPI0026F0866D|nr:stage II sporulation protein R [Ruminococcus bromii]